jgi:8-amino-7-oxononanoate synthase
MYRSRLDFLARRSLLRQLRTIDSAITSEIELDGRKLLLLSSNNYLDLATHPKVTEAAMAAVRRYGVGTGASRLLAGTLRPHTELETRLAAFKRVEAALVFSTGYQANLGAIQTIAEDCATIFADRLCHASLIDACRLSRKPLRVYRHRDAVQLRRLLNKHRGSALIVTDGVFSMDGDLAPVPALQHATEAAGATLMLDDAHGTGVMGPEGRGTVTHFGLDGRGIVQMGTLSKALGSFGGFLAGSHDLIEYVVNRARAFIYTTALPPAMAAAASAALHIIESEPERRAQLWSVRHHLHDGLRALGCDTLRSESPIIPILVGDVDATVRLSESLLAHGIYAPAIRPPTVSSGACRVRLSVTAGHTAAHIDRVLEAFEDIRKSDRKLWEQITNPRRPTRNPAAAKR